MQRIYLSHLRTDGIHKKLNGYDVNVRDLMTEKKIKKYEDIKMDQNNGGGLEFSGLHL